MTTSRYEIWDVFTNERFAGNALAVVSLDAPIETSTMQAITREFNLSETVFILPAEDAAHDARLRIFTPGYEMPFAGHPTVGASIALALRNPAKASLVLELNTGVFNVSLRRDAGAVFAEFLNPVSPVENGVAPSIDALARALSIPPDAIDNSAHLPRRVGAGVNFIYVAAPLSVVRQARFDSAAFEALMLEETVGVLLYASGGDAPGVDYHVRMFAPGAGVPEDPATGAAACALPGQLALSGALGDGAHELLVEQGVEMGRPSYIHVRCDVADGAAHRVRVGGEAVKVAAGEIYF